MESSTNRVDGEEENGSGETVQFQRKDGVEKDGYICFPVEAEEEVVVEEEKEIEDVEHEFSTCPEDPRFQQTNRTKWCYRMYVDYQSCRHLLGENAKQCNYFYRCYNSICPNAWIEKWDEQRAEGTFPCDTTKDCPNLNAKFEEQKPCP
ncbi:uncharacterized protein LOC128991066 [Macrosteles quadrilineatus]|uniref:uncharacterized protein LOC128991066 n=1 Tax=Macrosteles quadrilineatus TaxID=74068 RepID=UPI0023E0B087|nr:uncharacterized protein LOC128991066 [Macrosteles quadrilineatus]